MKILMYYPFALRPQRYGGAKAVLVTASAIASLGNSVELLYYVETRLGMSPISRYSIRVPCGMTGLSLIQMHHNPFYVLLNFILQQTAIDRAVNPMWKQQYVDHGLLRLLLQRIDNSRVSLIHCIGAKFFKTFEKLRSTRHASLVYTVADSLTRLAEQRFPSDSRQVAQALRTENWIGHIVDAMICHTKEDYIFMKQRIGIDASKLHIVPLPLQVRLFAPRNLQKKNRYVGIFIGSDWEPNLEAVRTILKDIAPLLREIDFWIIGSVCEGFESDKMPYNVKLLGQLPDDSLQECLKSADIALAPIRYGSGMKSKVLTYLAAALPVVTTSSAVEGIDRTNGIEMIVDNLENHADHIRRVISDHRLYEKMSINAINIASNYLPNNIAAKIMKVYKDVLT